VQEENDAVTAEKGARIAGGKRFANALAGHSALRVSIADVCEEKVERGCVVATCFAVSRTSVGCSSSCKCPALAAVE
jgi:hypothetical protein